MHPRIIAGTLKNRKLLVPATSRPVTDRIKQSVFDLLGQRVEGASVLDLFAGSGSFGLEAISRGADSVVFVEADTEASGLLEQNIENMAVHDQAKICNQEAEEYLKQNTTKFDLVFCDPPFIVAHEFNLEGLADHLSSKGIIVFRLPTKSILPKISNLEILHSQEYGESVVVFLQQASQLA